MTLEQFLQGFAIYTVISILAVAWFVRIKNSTKKRQRQVSRWHGLKILLERGAGK